MTDIAKKHASLTVKNIGKIVEDFATNRVRWTRPRDQTGKPKENRRNVHLGDWATYLKNQARTDADGSLRLSNCEFTVDDDVRGAFTDDELAELQRDDFEARKKAVRREKQHGK